MLGLGWIFRRKLEKVLGATTVVRIHGVPFKIRKLSPLDYLQGSNALRALYDTSQKPVDTLEHVEMTARRVTSIKDHWSEVFLAAVVDPKLKKSKDDPGEGLPVEHLFTEWDLCTRLYSAIVEYSYGKKKPSWYYLTGKGASKST